MKKILYLTDLAYQAKGRNYCEEDIYITSHLKDRYDIALCHPKCSEGFEKDADLIVFRNTGGMSGFRETYDSFMQRVKENGLNTFNTFSRSILSMRCPSISLTINSSTLCTRPS